MMTRNEYKRVSKQIDELIKNKTITKGKRLILFGISDNTRQVIEILKLRGYIPEAIVDNDKKKQNSIFQDIPVYAVEKKLLPYDRKIVIFVYSFYYKEMNRQMKQYGYQNGQIYNLESKWEKTELFRLYEIINGIEKYHHIRKKYDGAELFICPYTGIGDAYLIGTFWKRYLFGKGIENYVMLVVNEACRSVLKLFHVSNIEVFALEDTRQMLHVNLFAPERFPLHILNDSFIYTNPVQWIRGHKGLNFTDMFRIGVFDLPDDVVPERPNSLQYEKARQYLLEHKIFTDKAILISPYSNTLAQISMEYWERLVYKLNDMGYHVYTNSSGEKEVPIKGTKALFFSIDIAVPLLNMFHGFIGVRSGFCDVVSSCICKKIVLYDKNCYFYAGTAFDYFSLNKMGLCDDACEILYDRTNEAYCIREVLSYL